MASCPDYGVLNELKDNTVYNPMILLYFYEIGEGRGTYSVKIKNTILVNSNITYLNDYFRIHKDFIYV